MQLAAATPPHPVSAAPSVLTWPPRPGSALYPTSPLGKKDPRIRTGRDVEWETLVDDRRNGVSETTIDGAIAWASGGRLVHSFGGSAPRTCLPREEIPGVSRGVPLARLDRRGGIAVWSEPNLYRRGARMREFSCVGSTFGLC
jgi:hypothetical protein